MDSVMQDIVIIVQQYSSNYSDGGKMHESHHAAKPISAFYFNAISEAKHER